MYNCTPPAVDMDMDNMDMDSWALTWSALTISNSSPMSEAETTELQWKNGDVVETLLVEPYCTAQISGEAMSGAAVAGKSSAAIQLAARNVTMTSPSGSAGASTSAVPPANLLPPTMEMIKNDRKRKERETDDTKSHNEVNAEK